MNTKVETLSELVSGSKSGCGDNVALCYGHFNAIHPGHIRYFHTARQYGTPLVVESDSCTNNLDLISPINL